MKTSLYELTHEYQTIMTDLVDADGEVSEDVMERLAAIGGDYTEKCDNVAAVMRTIETRAAAAKSEKDRLAKLQKSYDSQAARLKLYLYESLIATDTAKVEGPRFTITVARCPASVDVLNDGLVPEEFRIPQEPKLDRRAILAALKEGTAIEGCELVSDKTTIRIR